MRINRFEFAAIDRGAQTMGVTPATDVDGQARSNPPDVGADEWQ